MITTDEQVTFSRQTWEELRADDYFRELIEVIEDREALLQAKQSTEFLTDLDDYHNSRMNAGNVQS